MRTKFYDLTVEQLIKLEPPYKQLTKSIILILEILSTEIAEMWELFIFILIYFHFNGFFYLYFIHSNYHINLMNLVGGSLKTRSWHVKKLWENA